MIVSASRRTDIPAYYSRWFMGRVDAGYCLVRNPYDMGKTRRVSLDPADLDFVAFWTRDPRPLAPSLRVLDERGIRHYVQMTITGYPLALEPGAPPLAEAIDALCDASDRIGPDRVLWRYDPVVAARGLEIDYHLAAFERIAAALEGRTRRVTLSLVDEYAHTAARLAAAGYPEAVFGSPRARAGTGAPASAAEPPEPYPHILASLAAIARSRGMTPIACAEAFDLSPLGIEAGACVDAGLAASLWGLELSPRGDPGQRTACRCAPSVDIGAYGGCPAACAYCYANRGAGALAERGPGDECL
jgi:hypothetical protein